MWVQELKTSGGTSDVDLPGTSTAQATLYPEIPSRWQLTDIPSLIYTSDDTPPASLNSERRQPRWLERVKTEDGHGTRHLSLRRQNSTDSDFPRSRSVSLYSSSSRATESGYSSGEFGNTARSRSVSYEDMPDSDHSQTSDDNLLHDSVG